MSTGTSYHGTAHIVSKSWLQIRENIARTAAAVPGMILVLATMQQALAWVFRTRATAGLGVSVGGAGKRPLRT